MSVGGENVSERWSVVRDVASTEPMVTEPEILKHRRQALGSNNQLLEMAM